MISSNKSHSNDYKVLYLYNKLQRANISTILKDLEYSAEERVDCLKSLYNALIQNETYILPQLITSEYLVYRFSINSLQNIFISQLKDDSSSVIKEVCNLISELSSKDNKNSISFFNYLISPLLMTSIRSESTVLI